MARRGPSEQAIHRLIGQVLASLAQPESDARPLVQQVNELRAADWQSRMEGQPATWDQFCRERLGCEAADLQEILNGAVALQEAGLVNPSIAQSREALRFEVDAPVRPAEAPTPNDLTPVEEMQRSWLNLTERDRSAFLAWASSQEGNHEIHEKHEKKTKTKRKRREEGHGS